MLIVAHNGNACQQPPLKGEASKKHPQPTKGPWEITTIIHGLSFFLWPILGILYQLLQWYLRIGVNFSLGQSWPFQISHGPNFPFPGYVKLFSQPGSPAAECQDNEHLFAVVCYEPRSLSRHGKEVMALDAPLSRSISTNNNAMTCDEWGKMTGAKRISV